MTNISDNLKEAFAGERPMLIQAEADGHKAKRMFGYAVKAEAVPAELYRRALAAARAGTDLGTTAVYLSPICGHHGFNEALEKCLCGNKREKYMRI